MEQAIEALLQSAKQEKQELTASNPSNPSHLLNPAGPHKSQRQPVTAKPNPTFRIAAANSGGPWSVNAPGHPPCPRARQRNEEKLSCVHQSKYL